MTVFRHIFVNMCFLIYVPFEFSLQHFPPIESEDNLLLQYHYTDSITLMEFIVLFIFHCVLESSDLHHVKHF